MASYGLDADINMVADKTHPASLPVSPCHGTQPGRCSERTTSTTAGAAWGGGGEHVDARGVVSWCHSKLAMDMFNDFNDFNVPILWAEQIMCSNGFCMDFYGNLYGFVLSTSVSDDETCLIFPHERSHLWINNFCFRRNLGNSGMTNVVYFTSWLMDVNGLRYFSWCSRLVFSKSRWLICCSCSRIWKHQAGIQLFCIIDLTSSTWDYSGKDGFNSFWQGRIQ